AGVEPVTKQFLAGCWLSRPSFTGLKCNGRAPGRKEGWGLEQCERTAAMLIRTTCFAAIGGFLFGYDLGLIGGALLGFSEDLGITKTHTQEAIVGALKLGAAAGTFIGGALMLRYGRRPAIAATSITGVIGPILMASAQGAGALVLGRVMSGLGIGICAICVPAYLAEIAPAAQRGAVVQVYELMLCVGMLAATAIDWLLHYTAGSGSWRWMVGIPVLPGAVMGLALMVLPESPRWLVMRNEMDKALSTLRTIMDGSQTEAFSSLFNQAVPPGEALAQAEHELMLLWSSVEKDKAASQNRKARVQLSRALPSPGAETEGQVKGEEEASWRDPSPCIPSQLPPSPSPTATTPSQALPAPFEQLPDKGEVQQQALAPWPLSKTDAMHQPLLKGSSSSSAAASSAVPAPQPSGASGVWRGGVAEGEGQQGGGAAEGQGGSPAAAAAAAGPAAPGVAGGQIRACEPGRERNFGMTMVALLLDIYNVARGEERRAFAVACCLAIFNQATASTAIINYAPKLLQRLGGMSASGSLAFTFIIAITKVLGVSAGGHG
ncbi:MFS domain-containing protein, partial [Haematococcus lacustris]